jgi:1-phosphofructokinase
MSETTRIATLSLNPAIDQTAEVSHFTAGAVNRVAWERADAGGKGINVAAFLAHAGLPVTAAGLLGRANDGPFNDLFARKDIADRCQRLAGSTRVNVKIVDPVLDQVTDINFPGLSPAADDLRQLETILETLCDDHDWFVLSGSVPSRVSSEIYADLIDRLRSRGRRLLLDASGAPLAAAVGRGPDIIKPNIDELGELVGRRLTGQAAVLEAARSLVASGIGLVAVSMGADGALFVEPDNALLALPPRVEVKSTVGAGDAMVAGILAGTLRGLDLAGRARLGTAFSLAALGQVGPELPSMSIVESFTADVEIRPLDNH